MGKRWLRTGAMLGIAFAAEAFAQSVPQAPPVPDCPKVQGDRDCRFNPSLTGNPTSVSGNRVILFRYSKSGGHGTSRSYLDSAVKRLASRYSFIATITEDPAVFTAANLANTKVVIMSNGDGDVLPPGEYRTALEEFNQVKGWGVIWIHAACAFISSAWPFGQKSCVQLYYHQNPSGTNRRVFLDSGTADIPDQGIRNPQSGFLLQGLPGWNGKRSFALNDEFYCFQAPARNASDVNVLLGYDRGSGLPDGSCPNSRDASEAGSQDHNLAWAHRMGNGISIFNSLGHDEAAYKAGGNMGDSLLWRFIRYAAKDWNAFPGGPLILGGRPIRVSAGIAGGSSSTGTLVIDFADPGRHRVTVADVSGKRVCARAYAGAIRAEIPGLRRGIYYVRVESGTARTTRKVGIL